MSSKSELTKTIESQQSQITRLQQRFTGECFVRSWSMISERSLLWTDVVSAYKNLQKEKEALESTVRVLSTSAATATPEEPLSTDSNATAVVKEVRISLPSMVPTSVLSIERRIGQ